jgi:hypothetical protein
LRHSLQAKKATATNNGGPDLFETVPAIHAAVRVDNLGEQFIHHLSPSELRHERTTRQARSFTSSALISEERLDGACIREQNKRY